VENFLASFFFSFLPATAADSAGDEMISNPKRAVTGFR
jgi:hypothetical protein